MRELDMFDQRIYDKVAPVLRYARAHHAEVLLDLFRGFWQHSSSWAGISTGSSGMKA